MGTVLFDPAEGVVKITGKFIFTEVAAACDNDTFGTVVLVNVVNEIISGKRVQCLSLAQNRLTEPLFSPDVPVKELVDIVRRIVLERKGHEWNP